MQPLVDHRIRADVRDPPVRAVPEALSGRVRGVLLRLADPADVQHTPLLVDVEERQAHPPVDLLGLRPTVEAVTLVRPGDARRQRVLVLEPLLGDLERGGQPEDLLAVLNKQREEGGRLGEVLLRLKMLSEDDITAALAEHFRMEYIHFDDVSKADIIDMDVARLLPESIAQRFSLVAIREVDNKVIVAMADPLNVIAIDTVTLKLKRQIKPVISSPREIQRAIDMIYHGSDVEEEQLRSLVEQLAELEARESELMEIEAGHEIQIVALPEIEDIGAYGRELWKGIDSAEHREKQLLLRSLVKSIRLEINADRELVGGMECYPLPGFEELTHKVSL